MNGRERELTAIRHETPDRIPVDAICIENRDALAAHLAIAPEEVPARLGLDGWVVAAGYRGPMPPPISDAQPVNEWGASALQDYGVDHVYPLAAAEDARAVETYAWWPDPALYSYAETAESARPQGIAYALRGPYWQPLFCRACSLLGMEELLVKMLAAPAVVEAVLACIADRVAVYCERFLDACGETVPILCLGDDFATQRGMLLAPELWRRFLKPHYARLFAIGKQRGKFVWFHSCGDVTAVLPDLIDIGLDVWETVQLHTLPITAAELKREYGRRLAFFGGINTQRLPFASPEEVRAEVRRCIERLGEGGGYICGPDHHVKPDVSAENTVALFAEATTFRRPGYTQ
jgi:uroporphyrinogen decarboxylase